jgi:hypothetical protein
LETKYVLRKDISVNVLNSCFFVWKLDAQKLNGCNPDLAVPQTYKKNMRKIVKGNCASDVVF